MHGLFDAVSVEDQRCVAREEADDLIARRMNFPRWPIRVEAERRNEKSSLEAFEPFVQLLENCRSDRDGNRGVVGINDDERRPQIES